MAVDSKHPLYDLRLEDWMTMRDTHAGEREIKEKGIKYLSPTAGQRADGLQPGQLGAASYDAYRMRAVFPDVVYSAITAMVGVMHNKPPNIELPATMEPMLESATLQGESLPMLLRRINEEQLTTGRTGLLLDVPTGSGPDVQPYIAMYLAETILNWDDGTRDNPVLQNLNLVTLDESEFERVDDFEWEFENKYRVLILGDPDLNEPVDGGVYRAGVFNDSGTTFNQNDLIEPSIRGQTLDEIPFVFINATDVVPSPDKPPLLGLAHISLSIYRGEADYRQALFMQGQDTLVVSGGNDPEQVFRTGANASIILPLGADAKFIGVDSKGLSEMRSALENDQKTAAQKGAQLMDSVSREKESGDALKIRVAARTATLNEIALAGAFGLEQLLKIAARWMGANPDEVQVIPNLDFTDDNLGGQELVEFMTAKSLGAPLSLDTIHLQMQDKGITEKTFEEEIAAIEGEVEMSFGSMAEDGPEEEEEDPEQEETDDIA